MLAILIIISSRYDKRSIIPNYSLPAVLKVILILGFLVASLSPKTNGSHFCIKASVTNLLRSSFFLDLHNSRI